MKKQKISLIIIIIHTLAVALFADIRSVNWALVYGGFVSGGVMNTLYPLVVGLIAITAVLHVQRTKVKLSYSIFVICYLLFSYFFTVWFLGHPRTPLSLFLTLSLFALLIPSICHIDARIFLKGIMFFPFFAIFRLDDVFPMVTEWQNFMDMDASYGFLVPVVATFVYLFYYFKDEDWVGRIFTLLLTACNMVFCGRLFVHGSRGVVLSILLLLIFMFVARVNDKDKGIAFHRRRLRIVTIVLLVIASSYITFFAYADIFLKNSFGKTFYAVEKVARMGAEGDLDNGRNDIAKVAIDKIWDRPILGHGIDRFEDVVRINYPHNFILQILFDGGAVMFLALMIPFVVGMVRLLKRCSRGEFAVFCVLFFSSVPGALFSQDLWEMPVLWMTMGFCISKGFVMKDEKDNQIVVQ